MAANPTSLNTGAQKNATPATAQKNARRRTFDPVSNLDELRVPKELIEAAKVRIDSVGKDITEEVEQGRPISETLKTEEALRRAGFYSDGEPKVRRSTDVAFPLQAVGYAVIALICRVRHISAWLFRAAGIGLAIFGPAWCPPALIAFLSHVGGVVAQLPADPSAYANDGSSTAWLLARAFGHDLAFGTVALMAVWTLAVIRRRGEGGYRVVVTGFAGQFSHKSIAKPFGETRNTWVGLLIGGVIEAAVFYVATPLVWSLF